MLKMNSLNRIIFAATQMFTYAMSELSFNRIKELLVKKGKHSTELSKYVGVTTRTVSTWCTNRNQPPVEMLFEIADFLEVEAGELLSLKKDLIPVGAGRKNVARKTGRKPAAASKTSRRKRP